MARKKSKAPKADASFVSESYEVKPKELGAALSGFVPRPLRIFQGIMTAFTGLLVAWFALVGVTTGSTETLILGLPFVAMFWFVRRSSKRTWRRMLIRASEPVRLGVTFGPVRLHVRPTGPLWRSDKGEFAAKWREVQRIERSGDLLVFGLDYGWLAVPAAAVDFDDLIATWEAHRG